MVSKKRGKQLPQRWWWKSFVSQMKFLHFSKLWDYLTHLCCVAWCFSVLPLSFCFHYYPFLQHCVLLVFCLFLYFLSLNIAHSQKNCTVKPTQKLSTVWLNICLFYFLKFSKLAKELLFCLSLFSCPTYIFQNHAFKRFQVVLSGGDGAARRAMVLVEDWAPERDFAAHFGAEVVVAWKLGGRNSFQK